jgi:predicted DNA-binding transcriptional regulator AlpA
VIRYLSLREFADLAGLEFDTMKAYRKRGLLPPEDAQIGRNRGWKRSTAEYWIANRLGRGARTDLRGGRTSSGNRCIRSPEVRRAAARLVIAANTANGKAADPWIVAIANQDQPRV